MDVTFKTRLIKTLMSSMLLCLALYSNCYAAEDRPPELKALVSTSTQVEIVSPGGDIRFDKVANWKRLEHNSLFSSKLNSTHFIQADLFYQKDEIAIVSYLLNTTISTITVLDAISIRPSLRSFRVVNGALVYKKTKGGGSIPVVCKNQEYGNKIMAIAVPEPKYAKQQCQHWTSKINIAWVVDEQSGKIGEAPSVGTSCLFADENDCHF